MRVIHFPELKNVSVIIFIGSENKALFKRPGEILYFSIPVPEMSEPECGVQYVFSHATRRKGPKKRGGESPTRQCRLRTREWAVSGGRERTGCSHRSLLRRTLVVRDDVRLRVRVGDEVVGVHVRTTRRLIAQVGDAVRDRRALQCSAPTGAGRTHRCR